VDAAGAGSACAAVPAWIVSGVSTVTRFLSWMVTIRGISSGTAGFFFGGGRL
jgi:hypothetical protein